MRIREIQTLYAYNEWANARLLATVERLPAEQFTTAALDGINLRDRLVHILVTESIWLARWRGIKPESVDFPNDFPTLEALRTQWRKEQAQLVGYLATLHEDDLDRTLTYTNRNGTTYTFILWHLLLHAVNHGTQHRSEVALLLTTLGYSSGNLDFAEFVLEQGLANNR
jgi:uncharacterized damage-inducible protein DinB